MSRNKQAIGLFIVILLDQVSKYLIGLSSIPIVLNKGISFNFFANFPVLISSMFLVFVLLSIYFLLRQQWLKYPLATILFFGGAGSNIVDRIMYGGVRDWLVIPFSNIKNNLADWFIFLGLLIFMYAEYKDVRERKS